MSKHTARRFDRIDHACDKAHRIVRRQFDRYLSCMSRENFQRLQVASNRQFNLVALLLAA
jgi:hypothetical protein